MNTSTLHQEIDVHIHTPRLLTFLFGFCMFSTGACGLVSEYALATVSTYILGNSIEQFSITIALMMFMMGISGLVQEKMSDRNLIGKFMFIEVAMALIGGFAPIIIYATFGYMSDYFMLVHYALVMSIGFLIGFEIPIVMRIIDQYGVGIKHNLKIVYAMDYIGAFVGAIIWVYFLLKYFPLTEISFIVSSFNFIVAATTVIYFIKQNVIKSRTIPLLVLSITALLLYYGYSHNREWNIRMEQQFYDDPIVSVQTTKYQHLVLTENNITSDVRLYINGNTQFSSLDEKRYHELLVHPTMELASTTQNILILGGGDGLALREVLKYDSVESVTLVDLDPDMVQFASHNEIMKKLNKNAFSDARVFASGANGVVTIGRRGVYMETSQISKDESMKTDWVASVDVYNVDADRFVSEQHDRKWDVIIIDFPDPNSVELAKLYSKEFFKKLRWHMHDDTMISIQATSPYHAKEAYLTIRRTLEAAGLNTLPYQHNIPSFGNWGWFLAWNNGNSQENIKNQLSLIKDFKVSTDYITPEVMMSSLVFGKNELLASKSGVNTIMQPILLHHYIDDAWVVD